MARAFWTGVIVVYLAHLSASTLAQEAGSATKHLNAGIARLNAGDLEAAAQALNQSIAIKPGVEAYLNLAKAYLALEKYAEALEVFDTLFAEHASLLNKKTLSLLLISVYIRVVAGIRRPQPTSKTP